MSTNQTQPGTRAQMERGAVSKPVLQSDPLGQRVSAIGRLTVSHRDGRTRLAGLFPAGSDRQSVVIPERNRRGGFHRSFAGQGIGAGHRLHHRQWRAADEGEQRGRLEAVVLDQHFAVAVALRARHSPGTTVKEHCHEHSPPEGHTHQPAFL